MTKDLKFLAGATGADPLTDIVAAVAAVAAINGHTPDDDELRELLQEQGAPVDDETLKDLRAMLIAAGVVDAS